MATRRARSAVAAVCGVAVASNKNPDLPGEIKAAFRDVGWLPGKRAKPTDVIRRFADHVAARAKQLRQPDLSASLGAIAKSVRAIARLVG